MAVQQVASRQGGVIRRSQAIASGLTDRQITTRLRTKRWTKLTDGAYRTFELEGRLNLIRAAVATLPGAVASHFSAAELHGISRVDDTVVSVLVHSRTTHAFPGVRVFRCRDLAAEHITSKDGLPLTTVARTVVDLASTLRPLHLEAVIDEVLAAQHTSLDSLQAVLESVARRGKPGVQSMRAALEARIGEDGQASVLEKKGSRLLRDAGFDSFVTEFPMPWAPNRRFDVAFEQDNLAIEWDSRRWHLQAKSFDDDRFRDANAVANGWRVLRFSWKDVHDRPDHVINSIRAALAA